MSAGLHPAIILIIGHSLNYLLNATNQLIVRSRPSFLNPRMVYNLMQEAFRVHLNLGIFASKDNVKQIIKR